jgi:hypothetical protein
MGMYNRVVIKCPSCGEENELQSKSGTCNFDTTSLDELGRVKGSLVDVAAVEGDPIKCSFCSTMYYFLIHAVAQVLKVPDNNIHPKPDRTWDGYTL